jgi:hypothetical protein
MTHFVVKLGRAFHGLNQLRIPAIQPSACSGSSSKRLVSVDALLIFGIELQGFLEQRCALLQDT